MTLPTGTVTFLRSDIEGSMELARALGAGYDELNAEHAGLVRAAVEAEAGQVVRTEGDAFFVVFTEAGAGARAAIGIQRAMADHAWPEDHPLRVRIGLHTGAAVGAGDDYGGFEVNRAARVGAVGWGGQIVLSDPTRALIAADPAEDWVISDLGRHRLKGVDEPERLYQLSAPGLQAEFPRLHGAETPTTHLPVRGTSFIGREAELETLAELLRSSHLLTLSGPGGTGKTTLTLELARRHAADHLDGAWFVDLQTVREAAEVQTAIAHGLGLLDGASGPAADRLFAYAAEREMLIVVDNFEQVIDAADVVAALLEASPRSRCIVSSRIPLRLALEQEFPVRPLEVTPETTGDESDAVRLFVDRVRRIRPGQAFGPDELGLVGDICALLDGLPLAIELAAARAAVLPLATIRDRLRQQLPLPGSGPRDLPERQRTIESTVAWSYELLDPAARQLLAYLAVFVDSFELEQVEAVCGEVNGPGLDILEGLYRLTEQSLLQPVEDGVGGVRFRMLGTIRSFAAGRLAEEGVTPRLRDRHAAAYAELARSESVGDVAEQRAHSIDRINADDGNIHAAFVYLVDHGDAAAALPMLAAMWRYWVLTGHLRDRLPLAIAALELPEAQGTSRDRLRGLAALGGLFYWSGDLPRAIACYEEQLALATRLGDIPAQAEAWYNLSFGRHLSGDHPAGMEAVNQAERLFLEAGEDRWLAQIAWSRSLALSGTGDPRERARSMQEVIARLEPFDDPAARSQILTMRAQISLLEGDAFAAVSHIVQSLRVAYAYRERVDMIVGLQLVAMGALQLGRPELGAMLIGISDGEAERYGIVRPASMSQITGVADPEGMFIGAMGQAAFDAAVVRGRRLTLADGLDLLDEYLAKIEAADGPDPSTPTPFRGDSPPEPA